MNLKNESKTIINSFDPSKYKTSPEYTLNNAWNDYSEINVKEKSGSHTYTYLSEPDERIFTKKGDDIMGNNDLLKTYIEKVDRDQSDLRADIRASEERTLNQLNRIESRMDERLNRIEDLISETRSIISSNSDNVDKKLEQFRGDIREHKFFRVSSAIGIIGVCLATIIGIVTMIISLK